jgi:hypothetical protein
MDQVNEQSSAFLTTTLLDKDEAPAQPTSASYTIHDVTTGTEIRGTTSLTVVLGVVEIALGKADNTMNDPTRKSERRRVTVNAIYGSDDHLNDFFVYEVKNLAEVT